MLRYRGRISGPLLDRIDLHVEVPALREGDLDEAPPGEPSRVVRERVAAARERQVARQGFVNAALAGAALERECAPDEAGRQLLRRATSSLALSARAFHRVLKVARTIADLAGATEVSAIHLAEAIACRDLERATNR